MRTITESFLNKQRKIGDLAADCLVESLFKDRKESELYTALHLSEEEILKESSSSVIYFLRDHGTQPDWLDENRIVRGQQVFERYATEIMTLLGVMALPYCYAASPGNKALFLSERMRKAPHKRLSDTAEFIISVSTKGNLGTGKFGHININKTRLIHAIARYHLVTNPHWDMRWGLPINQEDMAGTNLAFSVLILTGLNQSGFVLSDQQKEDFIYLWKYIGLKLGIDETLLPDSFWEAFQLANIIKQRNFKKSAEGEILARELLNYYRTQLPSQAAYFVNAQVRHFLGPEVSGYIGLEAEPVTDGIHRIVSSFNEVKNFLSLHKDSFSVMISNQQLLRKRIG